MPSGGGSGGSGGGDATLLEETFTVTDYDQSKYDRVARISCTSADSQTVMILDINIELFPCSISDSLHVVLATTLSPDGSKNDDKGWRDMGKGSDAPATIADLYDYVCHGKVYKFEETYDGNTMCVTEPNAFSECYVAEHASCAHQKRLHLIRRPLNVATRPSQEADTITCRHRVPPN